MKSIALTPKDWVYLRASPSVTAPELGKVHNGQTVNVSSEQFQGWTRLDNPAGWVFPDVKFVRLPDYPKTDYISDGYESPVGTPEQRASARIWPEGWSDASPFASPSPDGKSLHTGVDLNLNLPGRWNADKDAPLYTVASGVVTTAQTFKTWGWLIIIRHDALPDGTIAWSRYAHMATVGVVSGQRLERGDQIGTIGDAFGRWSHHLHYDIARTDILERMPHHWPLLDKTALFFNYLDPRAFIESHHYTRYAGG